MISRSVIIEISASRLDVATVSHGVIEGRRIVRFDRTDWPAQWVETLGEVGAELNKAVRELGAAGLNALMIYATPGTAVGVTVSPLSVAPEQAEASAILALSAMAENSGPTTPGVADVLATDKPGSADAQRHTLAMLDRESTLGMLAAMMRDAGVVPVGMIPAEAVAIRDGVRAAGLSGEGVRAHLWMADHRCVFVVMSQGRILFVRPVGLGLQSFVESLTRPLTARGAQAPEVRLTRARAREIVTRIGIPSPGQVIDGPEGLSGASILPAIQPLLQRLGVEAKQSLRYAVTGESRESCKLVVCGPGGSIPGLGEAFARQTGMALAGASEKDAALDAGEGLIPCILAQGQDVPLLLPADLRELATTRRVRRSLYIGAAMALALIGAEYFVARAQTSATMADLARVNAKFETCRDEQEFARLAIARRAAVAGTESKAARAIGDGPEYGAVLKAIALAAPEDVRLTSLESSSDDGRTRAIVRGYVVSERSSDVAGSIRTLVNAMAKSPVFRQVRLGATHRSVVKGREIQSFDINIELVALPAPDRLVSMGAPE